MQKRYQILKDFAATSSFSASARENRVSYSTARSICDKFVTTAGDFQPGARGRPDCKMQPFMAAYLEAMVLVNPFLYLEEMQDRLMTDLNLLPNEVLSVPVICRTLHELNLSKHKSTKVPQERFTPYNLVRRRALVQGRDRQDPAKLFFRDETAFNKLTDMRSSGWCSVGEVISSVEPKRDVREKISAFAVVGYNEGVVNCHFGKKKLKRKLTHTFSYIVFNNSYTQTVSNRVLNRARRSSLSPCQWSYETPNKPLSPTTV